MTRFRHREIARELGYQGDFGQGQHSAFLSRTPGAAKQFETAIAREVKRQQKVAGSTEAFRARTGQIDALQAAKAGLSFGRVLSQTGGAISNAINNTANKIAPNVFRPGGNFVGPPAPNTLSLSGTLTGAGAGYTIGNLIGAFTDLNQQGSSIGGAIGGAVGGSGVGASIGVAGGPIGIAVGSVVGSVLGGFFGPEPSQNASNFFGILKSGGNFNEFRTASDNIETSRGQSVGESFAQFTESFSKATGANFENSHVFGGYNDKYNNGYFIRTATFNGDGVLGEAGQGQNLERRFNPQDAGSVVNAFAEVTDRLLRDSGKNQTIVQRIDDLKSQGFTTSEAINNLFEGGIANTIDQQTIENTSMPTTPKERITRKVAVAQKQFNDFITKVEKKKAGRASTILTGPRGLLNDPAEIFRPQLTAVA